jgi:hypothetical protein
MSQEIAMAKNSPSGLDSLDAGATVTSLTFVSILLAVFGLVSVIVMLLLAETEPRR